jgi:hypothetical protein
MNNIILFGIGVLAGFAIGFFLLGLITVSRIGDD